MDNEYSFARALAYLANPRAHRDAAEHEIETSTELAEAQDGARGLLVPGEALARAQTTGTTAAGGALVGQAPIAYADALRNALVMGAAGATVLTGLRADAAVPTMVTGAAASWLDEGITGAANVAESTPTMARGNISPKTVAASIPVSRRLILQGQPDVADLLARDLLAALATEIDAAALGASADVNAPDGLRQALAGQKVNFAGAVPTAAEILDLVEAVENSNAPRPVVVLAPSMARIARAAKIESTGEPVMRDGRIADKPVFVTPAMPADEMIAGGFADQVIAMFGNGLDLRLDRAAGAASDAMTLRAFADVGFLTRRASSFAFGGAT